MFRKTKRVLSLVLVAFMILPMFATSVIAVEPMTSLTYIDMNDSALKKVYFKLETDKDLASYAVNEEITFKATLWADDVQITTPYVQYAIEYDDGTARKVDYTAMVDGVATVKTKLTKAGAVRITLYACNESKSQISHSKIKTYTGGAIAGASDIKVTTTEPTDFDTFWKGELAKLDAVAPEIEYIADVSDKLNKEGFKCYEIRVKCAEANVKTLSETSYVSMFLAIPENAKAGSLQLDVVFSGYGVYDPAITAPWASGMNATLTVYAHSLPLDKENGWYVQHFRESYPEYDHANTKTKGYGWDYNNDIEDNNDPEKVYFRDMFLRDLQAIRFFKKALGDEGVTNTTNDIDTSAWKGLWNGKIFQVSGGSQGGMRTVAAGALDALSGENSVGITNLRVSVPWFADIADSTATGNIKSDFHPEYKPGLAYFDTALLAKRIEANAVTIGAGTADKKCPMSGVQAIYNNLKVNATLNFIQGKGHDASVSDAVGSADSSQSKIKAGIVSGTVTESGPSDWEFNPDTGVLTISNELKSGWVRITACTAAGAWGATIRDMVRHVVIEGHFSKIDPNAFNSYPLLETITLPQMTVQFDNNAFANCPKLTEIKIAGDAYIPGAVDLSRQGNSTTDGHPVNTLADKNAFSGSKSVKTLILNDFYRDEDWRRLNKDTLPVNLETIMGPADSTYLREFCAANGYTFVPYGKATASNAAWTYNETTKTVTIWGEGSIKEISASDAAFLSSAESLVINATITELGADTFAALTSLKSVTMKGNAPTVPTNAKPFGEKTVKINVYKSATGFGKTWCGYRVSTIVFVPGDVNCDEKINIIDAVLLAQYLAGWDVNVDSYSADCNGDGTINVVDAVLLAQYLAGWDVTLGGDNPPPTTDDDPKIGEDNEVEFEDFYWSAISDFVIAGALYNGDESERLADFVSKIAQATTYTLPVIDDKDLPEYVGRYIFLDDTNPDFSSYEIKVENGNITLYANYYSLDDCIKSFFADNLGYDLDSGKIIGDINITQSKVYTVEKSAVYTKEKLMSVLEEIYNDDSRLIIGQQMNQTYPIGEVFDREVEAFLEGCGVEAALYGWDCVGTMIYPDNKPNLESGRVKIAYQMIEYMREGGIISLSTHFPNPAEENPTPGLSIKHLFPNGDADWQDLFTEGTDTYNRYWAYVEQLGDFLQIFYDNGAPVMLRPFLEMNGSWCWYSMAYQKDGSWQKYPAEYIQKLWIDLYNYLTVERGFDNLIWVYSPNMGKSSASSIENSICSLMYSYPGDEYVDIVGADWYPGVKDQSDPKKMVNAYEELSDTGKIFAYTELSANGENRTVGDNYTFTATDYANLLNLYTANGVKSAYTLTWSSWDTEDGRVKLTIYEMGDGKEFYANNSGFLDKESTKKLLYP